MHTFFNHALHYNRANQKAIDAYKNHLADLCRDDSDAEAKYGIQFTTDMRPTLSALLVVLLITMPAKLK
eukprot:1744686-Karenia_brevis.AAC.1